ncbi:uncharacterized protein [Haliotis cracherodii]|uniref:uncharacterized protein n=1 Tax=Haliotis cracherodii TaxID=6455 RepID=UPI0039E868AF
MKVTLVLVIVSTIIAVIASEPCRDDNDCTHTTCDSSGTLACSHGACSCLVAGSGCMTANCTVRADCDSCTCRDTHDEHHCFDNHCQCGRGAPVGPGGPGGPGVGK